MGQITLGPASKNLAKKLVKLTDDTKRTHFVGGVYLTLCARANSERGFYLGGFRDWLCQVFPAIAKKGEKYAGEYSTHLSEVMDTVIKDGMIKCIPDPNSRKAIPPKMHHVIDRDMLADALEGMASNYDDRFMALVNEAVTCYEEDNSNGQHGDATKSFRSFYSKK